MFASSSIVFLEHSAKYVLICFLKYMFYTMLVLALAMLGPLVAQPSTASANCLLIAMDIDYWEQNLFFKINNMERHWLDWFI